MEHFNSVKEGDKLTTEMIRSIRDWLAERQDRPHVFIIGRKEQEQLRAFDCNEVSFDPTSVVHYLQPMSRHVEPVDVPSIIVDVTTLARHLKVEEHRLLRALCHMYAEAAQGDRLMKHYHEKGALPKGDPKPICPGIKKCIESCWVYAEDITGEKDARSVVKEPQCGNCSLIKEEAR